MGKKITFVPLPIYSVATFKNYIYFSGGGGGKTGIPNQILIFQRTVTPNPANRISTETRIYQNLTVSLKYQLLVCSANQNLLIFEITEAGKSLNKLYEIQVDQSFKNPTINSICFHHSQKIIAVGGDDSFVRFYKIQKDQPPVQIWQHQEHREQIRKIDSKSKDLFVSNDTQVAVIVDMNTKQTLRKFYKDQLNPYGSVLQSAFFYQQKDKEDLKLVLCHYIVRKQSYVTRQLPNGQYLTLQVSNDQSCATSKEGKYLGLACGRGETFMIDTQEMKCISKQKGHEFVITTGTVTKGRRFITATSSCSYLIQQQSGLNLNWLYSLAISILFLLLFTYGIGSHEAGSQL